MHVFSTLLPADFNKHVDTWYIDSFNFSLIMTPYILAVSMTYRHNCNIMTCILLIFP